MKTKILLFILAFISLTINAQNPTRFPSGVQITGGITTDNNAQKVVVQSANNVLNTISKTDLQDAFYYSTASALPVVGITDKLYITRDDNKLYRFNGTIYVPLGSDLSSKENTANKQNSLAVDGTGTKFPTVDAVLAGLSLKQPLEDQRLSQSNIPTFLGLNLNNTLGQSGQITINGTQNGARHYSLRNQISGASNSGFEIRDDIGAISPLAIEANGHVDVHESLSISLPPFTSNGVDKLQVGGTISASPATLSNQVVVKSQLDLKASLDSPIFTGTPISPTPTTATGIANKSYVDNLDTGNVKLTVNQTIAGVKTFSNAVTANSFIKSGGTASQFLKADGTIDSNSYAPTVSPALTGTPTAPTATAGTNTTQIATTAFVLANTQSIPQLESNAIDLTVWNNGKGNLINNTSFGEQALRTNTSGDQNTAIGRSSLFANNIGGGNTSIGFVSMQSNASGNNNTAVGLASISSNTSGSNNVAVGLNSGRFISDAVTVNSITDNSIYIGSLTKSLANNQTNQIVIGHDAIGAGSNTATLGNGNITRTILRGTVEVQKLNLATTTGSQSVGNANMVAGTITITTTAATTNSVIMLTRNSVGITGFLTYTTANGSFTINSNVIGDAGVISYVIFN